jgi:hypothetical protein
MRRTLSVWRRLWRAFWTKAAQQIQSKWGGEQERTTQRQQMRRGHKPTELPRHHRSTCSPFGLIIGFAPRESAPISGVGVAKTPSSFGSVIEAAQRSQAVATGTDESRSDGTTSAPFCKREAQTVPLGSTARRSVSSRVDRSWFVDAEASHEGGGRRRRCRRLQSRRRRRRQNGEQLQLEERRRECRATANITSLSKVWITLFCSFRCGGEL